jgi:hypothetical protein
MRKKLNRSQLTSYGLLLAGLKCAPCAGLLLNPLPALPILTRLSPSSRLGFFIGAPQMEDVLASTLASVDEATDCGFSML